MVQPGAYLTQEVGLRQEQIIAPHQIQSLEILAIPLLDLQARLSQELEANPALERTESEGEQLVGDPVEELGAAASVAPTDATIAEKDEFLASLMRLEESWQDYLPPDHARRFNSPDDDERRRFFFDTLTAEKTIEDELLEQLRTSDSDEDTKRLAALIIGNLDANGYCRAKLEDLARNVGATLSAMTQALKLVQGFEPPGIAARDLRECLLLQLERLGRKGTLAWQIVDKYLEPMGRNRLPDVARGLRVSVTALLEAWTEVRGLRPRPSAGFSHGDVQYVLPEATVSRENGKLVVTTNHETLPQLRISPLYRKLLEDPNTPPEVRQYIREKVTSGNQLMRSLSQRQSTIQRLTEVVLRHQQDFFEQGEGAMRPLTMSQVAQEIGVHETTVSRAIANKFIQTPRGLYPLRRFFTGGYETEGGDQLSNLGVKHKIQAMISEEDAAHPLSDQQLVARLKEQGLEVARRTVAKYREELGVPSSHLRRSYTA